MDFQRNLLWDISEGASPEPDQGLILIFWSTQSVALSWNWVARVFQSRVSAFVACGVRDLIYVEDTHSAHFVDYEIDRRFTTTRGPHGKLLPRGFACSIILKGATFTQWRMPQISRNFDDIEVVSGDFNVDDTSQMAKLSRN